MVIEQNRIKELKLISSNCSPSKFEKMSPASTATTDNFPSEEIIGKRKSNQRDVIEEMDSSAPKRQKVTNEHNPVELD